MVDERPLFLTMRMLYAIRPVTGWLSDSEADLLAAAACRVLRSRQEPQNLVEIGSYCGKSTIALACAIRAESPESRVYAIDPHGGTVGAHGQGIWHGESTLERFRHNIGAAGLSPYVVPIVKRSWEVKWDAPIALLFIDGLHDADSVGRDFAHFEPWIGLDSLVAFHDYRDEYPGVRTVVDELVATGLYEKVDHVESLYVVRLQGG